MANIALGFASCYISIKADFRVLYFPYSTWQDNDLSVIKNFLAITILNIPIVPITSIYYVKSG